MSNTSNIEDIPFLRVGKNIKVERNVDINNPQKVVLCDGITLATNSLICINAWWYNKEQEYNIFIDDCAYIGRNSIIEAFNKIIIGKGVLIGPNVYIADNSHEYKDFTIGIGEQGRVDCLNTISIKDGAWIGAGSTIIGGVNIGFGVVVAANTFVNSDIPDHCVVAGSPAKIIKICDYRTGEWVKVKNSKTLLNKILSQRGMFKGYAYYQELRKKDKISNDLESKRDLEFLGYPNKAIECFNSNNSEQGFNYIVKFVEELYKLQINFEKYNSINNNELTNIYMEINITMEQIMVFYSNLDFDSIKSTIRVKLDPLLLMLKNI